MNRSCIILDSQWCSVPPSACTGLASWSWSNASSILSSVEFKPTGAASPSASFLDRSFPPSNIWRILYQPAPWSRRMSWSGSSFTFSFRFSSFTHRSSNHSWCFGSFGGCNYHWPVRMGRWHKPRAPNLISSAKQITTGKTSPSSLESSLIIDTPVNARSASSKLFLL